jgi:hypothetical protein
MAEIPLPSFETLAKASDWIKQQAMIWLEVVKSPRDFVAGIDLSSTAEFGRSVQFLFFIIVCMYIIEIPIDAIWFHVRVFDAASVICELIISTFEVVLFSSSIYLFARAMRGKGEYRDVRDVLLSGPLSDFCHLRVPGLLRQRTTAQILLFRRQCAADRHVRDERRPDLHHDPAGAAHQVCSFNRNDQGAGIAWIGGWLRNLRQ